MSQTHSKSEPLHDPSLLDDSIRFMSGLLLLVLVEAMAGRSIPDSAERKTSWSYFFSVHTRKAHLFKPLPLALDRRGSGEVTGVDREALLWAGDDKWSDFTDASRQPPPKSGAHKQVTVAAAAAAAASSLALIQVAGPTWPLSNSQWAVSSTRPRATIS